ncbi:MAG: hypothetical protein ACOC56_05805 [Atribacterota bacterium]
MKTFKEFFILTESKVEDTFCYMIYAQKPYSDYLRNIQKELKLKGEWIEKTKFHNTIRYVKTKMSPKPLMDYLSDVDLPTLSGITKNFQIFGEDKCLVMELISREIHDWFKQVNKFMIDCGYPDSDYPKYRPHITLSEGVEEKPKFNPQKHKLKIDFTKHVVTDKNYDVIFERII